MGVTAVDNRCFSNKAKRSMLDPVISVGYSHIFNNNFYLGLSLEASLGKNSKKTIYIMDGGPGFNENSKIDGISYSLNFKYGYYLDKYNTTIYGIAGIKWLKVDFQWMVLENMEKAKLKTMPVVGAGFEKRVCNKLSFVTEYEHFWRKSTRDCGVSNPGATIGIVTDMRQTFKPSVHGNSIRIGFKYYPW